MGSKLEAARLATAEGTAVVIANGGMPDVLAKILAGDDVGTLIPPVEWRPARRRHIAVSGRKQGALVINDGALRALLERKASLLPIGVVAVEGVSTRANWWRSATAAAGYMAAAWSTTTRRLPQAGGPAQRRDRPHLGYRGYDALITRDNLVMGAV